MLFDRETYIIILSEKELENPMGGGMDKEGEAEKAKVDG